MRADIEKSLQRNRFSPSPGITRRRGVADVRAVCIDVLTKLSPTASTRILADASALVASDRAPKESAFERLEQAIGPALADRLVAVLSQRLG